jgi:AcrR family transcriptional regulator
MRAAEEGFAASGFSSTRLADIAGRAGITRPSLLHHYATKEDLYAAVVERAFAALGGELQVAMGADGTFLERLDALIDAFATFIERRPAIASLIVRELLDPHGPGSRILLQEVSPLLGRIEAFLRREGRGVLRADVPLRAALVHTSAGLLLREAAGPLARPIWGPGHHSRILARRLLAA